MSWSITAGCRLCAGSQERGSCSCFVHHSSQPRICTTFVAVKTFWLFALRLKMLLTCTSWEEPPSGIVCMQKCICAYVCSSCMSKRLWMYCMSVCVWLPVSLCVWDSVVCIWMAGGYPLPECRAHPERLIAIHVNESPWIKQQPKAYLHRVKMHVLLEEKSLRVSPWMKSVSLHQVAKCLKCNYWTMERDVPPVFT